MDRTRISSGTEWEDAVGYSRAVRVGDRIEVAGTTATDDEGEVVGEGDPYRQTVRALSNVEDALAEAGATMADVVRTRLFVTDASAWRAVGDAHGEVFAEVRPATTLVEVSALVDPAMLVEVEAVAVVD